MCSERAAEVHVLSERHEVPEFTGSTARVTQLAGVRAARALDAAEVVISERHDVQALLERCPYRLQVGHNHTSWSFS